MQLDPSTSPPEPAISPAYLWLLRLLTVACMFLLLWNARQSGTLAAVVFALPYLFGAWWLKPGTLRRGLATVAVAGIVLGSLAFFALAMAAAIPPEYFDRTPKEMHARITALELFLLTQAVLVIAAARAYFRARRGPLG